MYKINNNQADPLEPKTFSSLGWNENDMEELLRNNIDMICDEEESMLIVGKQVQNDNAAISDLTAVDNNGNLVLIEIKRDREDIISRKEAFEFQAIRYAASYATIQTPEDLVEQIYAPYIKRYSTELNKTTLTETEFATRKLNEFLETNNAYQTFNHGQRIILIASDYDEQTLSAVAWLNNNNVDIGCYKLIPYEIQDALYVQLEKVLPLTDNENYFIGFSEAVKSKSPSKGTQKRRNLPKINDMLAWGEVLPGDIITPKGRDDEAILKDNGLVEVDGIEMSLQKWLKGIFGWSSVQTYVFAIHKESGKSLAEIRENYLAKQK